MQVFKVLPFIEHWTQNNHVDNENQNNFKMFSFASFHQCVSNFPQMYVLSELFSDYCSNNPQFNLRKKKIQAHLLNRYADIFHCLYEKLINTILSISHYIKHCLCNCFFYGSYIQSFLILSTFQ